VRPVHQNSNCATNPITDGGAGWFNRSKITTPPSSGCGQHSKETRVLRAGLTDVPEADALLGVGSGEEAGLHGVEHHAVEG